MVPFREQARSDVRIAACTGRLAPPAPRIPGALPSMHTSEDLVERSWDSFGAINRASTEPRHRR